MIVSSKANVHLVAQANWLSIVQSIKLFIFILIDWNHYDLHESFYFLFKRLDTPLGFYCLGGSNIYDGVQ